MADFTPTQGRYLAFIGCYTDLHGYPPAESEIAVALDVSAPSVNQMVKTLERRGLISRQPGEARTIEILIPKDEVPPWGNRRKARKTTLKTWQPTRPLSQSASPSANLYVLGVCLTAGPVSKAFHGKQVFRVIEIRGDQTLAQLHLAIFNAYDRFDEHVFEFQFGRRPFDPDGPNYGIVSLPDERNQAGDARETMLDDLALKPDRVFGYRFDFGDEWFHQIDVVRVERAIATVSYPRVIKRVGKSPPQYLDE